MEIYLQPLLKKSLVKSTNQLKKIKICGLMSSVPFQKCKWCALKFFRHAPHKFAEPEIKGMYQIEWQDYLEKTRRHVGGKMWVINRPVAVFIDENYIGSDIELFHYISKRFVFHSPVNSEFYEALIIKDLRNLIESPEKKFIYLTFAIDNEVIGSLLFMLYSDSLPRTCEYFHNFCVANGPELPDGRRLCYKNSIIHRIVKDRWIQLGDLGIDSTIEGITVPDECYCIPHDRRGVLSLSKWEKHRNGPQFIISLNPNPWMNKYFIGFGQLIDGERTLRKIEAIKTYYESPQSKIVLLDCGDYRLGDEKMEIFDKKCCEPLTEGEGEDAADLVSYNSYIDSDITH